MSWGPKDFVWHSCHNVTFSQVGISLVVTCRSVLKQEGHLVYVDLPSVPETDGKNEAML